MFHNRRRDGDIWQRAMDRENAVAWAAIVSGAMSPDPLDPLPDDEFTCSTCGDRDCLGEGELEPVCETCGGTGTLTRSGPLGHVERKGCYDCNPEW